MDTSLSRFEQFGFGGGPSLGGEVGTPLGMSPGGGALFGGFGPGEDALADPFEKPPVPETENLIWPLEEVTLSTLASKVRSARQEVRGWGLNEVGKSRPPVL